MEIIEIEASFFKLNLWPKVYKGASPYNMNLRVQVLSNNFSANTEIDTGTLQFDEFIHQLLRMYNSLSGMAELIGNDGQKIVFEATKTGHIKIIGNLRRFLMEEEFKLDFSVEVDQTDLSKSMNKLKRGMVTFNLSN